MKTSINICVHGDMTPALMKRLNEELPDVVNEATNQIMCEMEQEPKTESKKKREMKKKARKEETQPAEEYAYLEINHRNENGIMLREGCKCYLTDMRDIKEMIERYDNSNSVSGTEANEAPREQGYCDCEDMREKALLHFPNYKESINLLCSSAIDEMGYMNKYRESKDNIKYVQEMYETKINYIYTEWRKLIPLMDPYLEKVRNKAFVRLEKEFDSLFY